MKLKLFLLDELLLFVFLHVELLLGEGRYFFNGKNVRYLFVGPSNVKVGFYFERFGDALLQILGHLVFAHGRYVLIVLIDFGAVELQASRPLVDVEHNIGRRRRG